MTLMEAVPFLVAFGAAFAAAGLYQAWAFDEWYVAILSLLFNLFTLWAMGEVVL